MINAAICVGVKPPAASPHQHGTVVALPPLGPLAGRPRVIVDALPEIKADIPEGRAREFYVTTLTVAMPGGAG